MNKKIISFKGKKSNVFDLLQGQVTADLNDLKSNKFIQSCLCDEKGFIKAEFLITDNNGIEILVDASSENILSEELHKFIKFYNLEVEIKSRKVLYKFFIKSESMHYLISNNKLFCDIEFMKNDSIDLLTKEEFELNFLLLGQFLFTNQDSDKYRPHDLGMSKSHVSFSKGCFRGQEVIARTEHLSKKKKEIIPISYEDEISIDSKKVKTLRELTFSDNIFKLVSFLPN